MPEHFSEDRLAFGDELLILDGKRRNTVPGEPILPSRVLLHKGPVCPDQSRPVVNWLMLY